MPATIYRGYRLVTSRTTLCVSGRSTISRDFADARSAGQAFAELHLQSSAPQIRSMKSGSKNDEL
ncbi:MAG: hypothetical protein DME66_04750, partial [Verrucomicrobia bacterium]